MFIGRSGRVRHGGSCRECVGEGGRGGGGGGGLEGVVVVARGCCHFKARWVDVEGYQDVGGAVVVAVDRMGGFDMTIDGTSGEGASE